MYFVTASMNFVLEYVGFYFWLVVFSILQLSSNKNHNSLAFQIGWHSFYVIVDSIYHYFF